MINLDKINKLLVFLTDNGIGLNAITINDDSFILDLFENENQKRKSNIIEKITDIFYPEDFGFKLSKDGNHEFVYIKESTKGKFLLYKLKDNESFYRIVAIESYGFSRTYDNVLIGSKNVAVDVFKKVGCLDDWIYWNLYIFYGNYFKCYFYIS